MGLFPSIFRASLSFVPELAINHNQIVFLFFFFGALRFNYDQRPFDRVESRVHAL